MSLEKDINQQKFRSEFQKSIINLIYTYHWMNEQVKKVFDQYDVTSQQFNILRILRGAGVPISTMQIRQRMLDKMSDTSRIVDRLIKKGLVKKNTCKSDRRLVDVVITEKGRKLLEKLDSNAVQMDGVMKNLSMAEAKSLNQLLDKIRSSGS
jgi:DNA-binding MarR family transcriptional regulator